MRRDLLQIFSIYALCAHSFAGTMESDLVSHRWRAYWIQAQGTVQFEYGVYHFRRTVDLQAAPEHLFIHVSGDNRYQLFVNGQRVAWGPARGDLTHWRYETVDIGPHLTSGRNVLAAVVWNDGPARAVAQISNRTAFLLQADGADGQAFDSDKHWKAIHDDAYQPQLLPEDQKTGYYALGPTEKLDGNKYPWGWESRDFDDSSWQDAEQISPGSGRLVQDAPNRWMMVPSEIPLEEQRFERLHAVRKAEGIETGGEFLKGEASLKIAAHQHVAMLLDGEHLTTAYPQLTVSGGKNATVRLHYAETLFTSKSQNGVTKPNRNVVEGQQFYGSFDTFQPDGENRRTYRPLFWRTFRYIRLEVETADEPLAIDDLSATFTAYPFDRTAQFRVADEKLDHEVNKILDTGWRTARLCAHETYMDCPYYEQLQYAGDARIQMLVSLYMTGDARLMKNGIALLNSSRTSEGATFSRAPSNLQQYIPPFSLWWIGMLHDYWMYVDDPQFVRDMMPGVQAVLDYFAQYLSEKGSLRKMPWWNFVDWVKSWKDGVPPAEADGSSSAALDLQLLLAYRWAADLEGAFGLKSLSDEYARRAEQIKNFVAAADWDDRAGLFADSPSHKTYSQQVNTLAVLAHVVSDDAARQVMEKTIAPAGGEPGRAQSSIYFRAYTNAALREVGLGDRYFEQLAAWREMLGEGLTTWAEWNGPDTRSDCHAWGSSPNFEFLRTVAGIESAAPGFRRVRVAPNLGPFKEVQAKMPHPRGEIKVSLRSSPLRSATVVLPADTAGEFVWQKRGYELHAGKNVISLDR